MGDVFANGKEVSGKATPNKSAAAFPSVCLSPPSPPAGPIPIPYPVTSMGSDTADGTGSVIIKKKETGKKNGSNYAKCNGNQPATKSFGMDVASHTLEGKTKFAAYSFDVMFEKGGAERVMDATTSNHSNTGTAFMLSAAGVSDGLVDNHDCKALSEQNDDFRKTLDDELVESDAAHVNQNHTVASGSYQAPSGATTGFIGVSCTSFLAHIYTALSQPVASGRDNWKKVSTPDGEKNHVDSDVCPGCTNPIGGQQCHAELNILNDIGRTMGSPPGGTVLLNIDWMSGGEQQQKVPCTNCQKRIKELCDAGCITIVICDEDDDSQDLCANPL